MKTTVFEPKISKEAAEQIVKSIIFEFKYWFWTYLHKRHGEIGIDIFDEKDTAVAYDSWKGQFLTTLHYNYNFSDKAMEENIDYLCKPLIIIWIFFCKSGIIDKERFIKENYDAFMDGTFKSRNDTIKLNNFKLTEI